MKIKLWIILIFTFSICTVLVNGNIQAKEIINLTDCSFNGHPLYGKIELVDSFPDVKVQIVSAFPDLKVQLVNNFPNKCGQWQIVTAFPDTKVKIVESFPNIKIQYVDAFPGLP